MNTEDAEDSEPVCWIIHAWDDDMCLGVHLEGYTQVTIRFSDPGKKASFTRYMRGEVDSKPEDDEIYRALLDMRGVHDVEHGSSRILICSRPKIDPGTAIQWLPSQGASTSETFRWRIIPTARSLEMIPTGTIQWSLEDLFDSMDVKTKRREDTEERVTPPPIGNKTFFAKNIDLIYTEQCKYDRNPGTPSWTSTNLDSSGPGRVIRDHDLHAICYDFDVVHGASHPATAEAKGCSDEP